jgi:hypothetical protein
VDAAKTANPVDIVGRERRAAGAVRAAPDGTDGTSPFAFLQARLVMA